MSRTEIFLIRHGETVSNLQGLLHGKTDVPLNELGLRQASQVADRLTFFAPISYVYSSPLQRARATANQIGARLGVHPTIRTDLTEYDFGDIEGYTLDRLQAEHPEMFEKILDFSDLDVGFPNGETRRQFHRRVWNAVAELRTRHQGERFVVVAHGGVIGSAIAQLTGGEPNDWVRYLVRNCSLTHLHLGLDGRVSVECLDDVSHLSTEGAAE